MQKHLLSLLALAILLLPATSALQADLLNTNPAPATAGEYVEITTRITSESTQESLRNLQVRVQDNQYVNAISEPRTYASIRPGDQITSTHRVYLSEQTPEGEINLQLRVETTQATLQFELPLYVRAASRNADLRVGQVRTTPQELVPDSTQNELRVTLQNLGEQEAELIRAELELLSEQASASYAYSLEDSLSSLAGGAQDTLTFIIDVEEEARENIPAQLQLTYRTREDAQSSPQAEQATLPLVLPIDNTPYLEVTHQELLTSSEQGSTDNTLRLTITNTGEEEALDARVRLFPDISYPLIFERTSQYLGASIKPGENRSLDVKYEVLSGADVRDYEVAVELESLVSTTRYTQQDTMSIPVSQGSGVGAQTVAWIIIGAITLLALSIGYTKRKK